MPDMYHDCDVGTIHHSNYGDFIVTGIAIPGRKNHKRWLSIKFITTGYEYVARVDAVREGRVKDPYYPTHLGIGYYGIVNDPGNEEVRRQASRWRKILNRCYDPNDSRYYCYGGAGVRVDPRWFGFENFYYDVKQLCGYDKYIKDPYNYALDKDYLQRNIPKHQRIYAPYTCLWLSRRLNAVQVFIDNIESKSSKFLGVKHRSNTNYPYHAGISDINCNYVDLGDYKTEIEAANAYNNYVICNIPKVGMPLNNLNSVDKTDSLERQMCLNVMCKITSQ